MSAPAAQGTQAVSRALRILALFSRERPEWLLSEVSAAARLNRTTAFRLLSALVQEGLLVRDEQSRRYRLGDELIVLGGRAARAQARAGQEGQLADRQAQVGALFAPWDRPNSPGCAVGVLADGEWLVRRGFGQANLEYGLPITPQTVFRVASLSKQFTATCLLLLAEAADVALLADVRLYLPELPAFWPTITLRHLLYHCSGLPDYLELMENAGIREADHYTTADALAALGQVTTLDFPPGTQNAYSNSNYLLLAQVVERVAGQSLRHFSQQHIFGPLGMADTHFHDDHTELVPRRASGYAPLNGGYRHSDTTLDIVGDGGLYTTLDDLARWDANFYNNRLGQGGPALIERLMTPGRLAGGNAGIYAAGLEISTHCGQRLVRHSGSFVGYRAEIARLPERCFTVIILANLSTLDAPALARRLLDIYLPCDPD